MQVTARAGESEIVLGGAAAAGERDDVLDMKRRPLERLAHAAVFAATFRALLNQRGQGGGNVHAGSLPRSCNAWARSNEISSLSTARAASSSFSTGCRRPSVFRSIRFWSCLSVCGGSRKSPMDSINDAGASMVADMPERCGPDAVCQRGLNLKPPPPALLRSSSFLCARCRACRRGSGRGLRLGRHRHPPVGC